MLRRFSGIWVVAVLIALLPMQPSSAVNITISGTVTASSGGAAIQGAQVSLFGVDGSTTTDASGNYTLSLDPPSPPMMRVVLFTAPGYAGTFAIASSSPVNAQLGQAATINGVVTSGSNPVAGASVKASFNGCPISELCPTAVTDADGRYSLTGFQLGTPGAVTITKAGYVDATSEGVTPAASQTYTRDVVMQRQGSITGVVTGPGGTPVAGVTVSAPGPNPVGPPRQTTTDASGVYTMADVDPGPVNVGFAKVGLGQMSKSVTVISGASATLDAQMALGNTITVSVEDENGTPATGVTINYVNADGQHVGPLSLGPGESTYTLADVVDGSYKFSATGKGLLGGWYDNATTVADATPVVVAGGQTKAITVRLPLGATLIQPFTTSMASFAKACVFALGSNRAASCVDSMSSPATLSGLSAGTYNLLLTTSGGANRFWAGGGSDRASASAIEIAKGESKTLGSIDASQTPGSLVAPSQPEVTRTADGFRVSSADYQGYSATSMIYQLGYRVSPSGSWNEVYGSGLDTSGSVSVTLPDAAYDFRIRAVGNMGTLQTPWSDIASYTPVQVPSAPLAPTVSQSGDDVAISWASVPQADDYRLQKRTPDGVWQFEDWTTDTAVTLAGLTPGDWLFRLRARNEVGRSEWSPSTIFSVGVKLPTTLKAGERAQLPPGATWTSLTTKVCRVNVGVSKTFLKGVSVGTCRLTSSATGATVHLVAVVA